MLGAVTSNKHADYCASGFTYWDKYRFSVASRIVLDTAELKAELAGVVVDYLSGE